jgi:uncharacterized C2H2 Zn-finger protein
MPSPSETAHVQWLLNEKVRLDKLISGAAARKKKIDEDTKRHRKMRTEVNKMIALYGEVDANEDSEAVATIEGRTKCPHCPETFTNNARVGEHMRKAHGIYGGLSGKVRPEVAARFSKPKSGKGKAA